MSEGEFLGDRMPRSWTAKAGRGVVASGLYLGNGGSAIEVAVATAAAKPSHAALQDVWKARRGGRAAPVVLIVLHPDGTALCGAYGETPPVYPKLDGGRAERLCGELLDQPDRHAALRFLDKALPSLDTPLPGLHNEGLAALHELQHGAPQRKDWNRAGQKAGAAAGKRNRDLLLALGFQVEPLDNHTALLKAADRRTALAIMLEDTESPEAGSERLNSLSPVSYALNKADSENLPWVVMVQGNRVRLYSTKVQAGVGRRGRTETYIECQPSLLADDHLAYLWLLYSAEALAAGGSLEEILGDSQRFAGDLAITLRERIYDEVVPTLAEGIAAVRAIERPSPGELAETYEMALTVLFRLLFIAYAEDRDLLPYRFNDAYRHHSLTRKAQELAECVADDKPIAKGDSQWQEVRLLCQAVAVGNAQWGVPAYDGGLFSSDAEVSPIGARLAAITLPNAIFERALRSLLVIDTAEGAPGAVDFRALGVREFGTIYEGLLESELALADADLKLGKNGAYLPAGDGDRVVVAAGNVYLHNRAGARKSSGSYYTKPFAVEHLLDGALEPALDEHLARVEAMDDTDASEALFDFRVADIAMGSGHFLVAAIDRIEKRTAEFLAKRNLPGVRRELEGLRAAARRELGEELARTAVVEDGQLLRRLIARRCIYGVDINPLSVQLTRLAVWIHTFVPGLPLSMLDHSLVCGNSLVGVGTLDEIRARFDQEAGGLFEAKADNLLGQAAAPLRRLANINDATLEDVAAARTAMREAREALSPTEALCDLIVAGPISEDERVVQFPFQEWESLKGEWKSLSQIHAAREEVESLRPLHFPVAFPEVFLRERTGFDVILGNPPWQEATVEEHGFWARHSPGLRGKSQKEQEAEKERLRSERPDLVSVYAAELADMARTRKALVAGPYPGMSTGDPDLYKAFCWRFWHLVASDSGRLGVVLPRSALSAKGLSEFRQEVFGESASVDIAILLNRNGWIFDDVTFQYTIGLTCVRRGKPRGKSIKLRGPYSSHLAFKNGATRRPVVFTASGVLALNDTASLPVLPGADSLDVFAQLREAPRLDFNPALVRTSEGALRARARAAIGVPDRAAN